jgi:hypothetical protein
MKGDRGNVKIDKTIEGKVEGKGRRFDDVVITDIKN